MLLQKVIKLLRVLVEFVELLKFVYVNNFQQYLTKDFNNKVYKGYWDVFFKRDQI